MKKKYYLAGFVLLLGLVIGYHFYAATQAEQQINKTIQEQTAKMNSISAQYSSIEVAPFGGSISIKNLTVVFGDHIERAQRFQLDISYIDFLNIYFGGMEYGLDHLYKAKITIFNPSYVNQSGLQEIKLVKLVLSYRGNALDGLRSAINGTAFKTPQSVEAKSNGLIVRLPGTTLSKIKAESFRYSGSVSAGKTNFWTNGSHQFAIDSLTWTPSENFQNSYRFFIKGFGYDTDAIPFQSAHLYTEPAKQDSLLKIKSSVDSDLAVFLCSGYIQLHNHLGNAELKNMTLSATQLSDSFQRVLTNIERLFSISIPRSENGISVPLEGTLSAPSITSP